MESNIEGMPLGESSVSSVSEISNFICTSSSRENVESKANARMPDTQSGDVDMPLKPSCLVEIKQSDDLENKSVRLQNSVSDQLPPQGNGGELMEQCVYVALPLIVDIAGAKVANHNSVDLGPCVADAKKSSVTDASFHLTSQNQSKNDIKLETEDATRMPLSNISDLKTANLANSVKEPDVSDTQTDNESSESDILEDDVKVCDICGDVGREELLAICSRCSDGAEHTYCMRTMLLKLPEGDWLCEECMLKEDESKKINVKSEDPGFFSNDPLPDLDFKLPATTLVKKGSHNSHASYKVSSASTAIGSETNTKTAEVAKSDSMLLGTFNNLKPSLVQEASCKIAASKGKSGNITTHPRCQPATSLVTPALPSNSSKPEARLLSPRGSLPSMDNLKSKVKSVLETFKPKSKLLPESTVLAVKKERAQSFVRSASFRSQSTSSPNMDTTSKTYSVNRADSQNIMLGKQKGIMERKNSLILDRPQSNLSASTNIMSPKLEQKDARSEGKAGAGEIRKQPPYTPKSSGLLSFRQPTSVEQKPGQIIPKDEASVSLGTSDRISDVAVEHGPSQSEVCAGRSDKNKDTGGLRSLPFAAVRGHRCQKCNEMGHLTQFCSVDKIKLSSLKPSALNLKPSWEQNVRDTSNKSSKWRHVIEAALLKTQLQKNHGFPAQPSNLILPNNNLSHENSFKDLKSNLAIHDRSLSASEGTKPAICSDVLQHDKPAICSDVPQHDVSKIEFTPTSDMIFGVGGSKSKSFMQNTFAGQASAIPELERIWLGCFEVQRNGRFSDKCYNVQAHLSTLASPKVSNVVTKFPDKVQLEEVSCMSAWPSQFRTQSPMEENIALFFFATDGESCEKSYNKLLENMLQNDLALKGSLDGVELLIFPSNKLPESCQRWNRLFFLWGVFRASKSDIPTHLNGAQKKFCGDRFDVPNFVSGSTHSLTVEVSGHPAAEACEQGNMEFPVCGKAVKSENRSQNIDANAHDQNSLHLDSLPSGEHFGKAGAIIEQALIVDGSSKQTISDNKNAIEERKDGDIYLKEAAPNLGREEAMGIVSLQTCAVEAGSGEKSLSSLHMAVASKRSEIASISALSLPKSPVASVKVADRNACEGKFSSKERLETAAVSGQLKDHVLGKEAPCWESRLNLKRSSSSSPELVVQASPSVGGTASWKELDNLSREVIPSKKIKLDANDQCLVTRDENHGRGFSSKVHPVHGSYLDNARDGRAACNEVFRKDSTSSEMVFFPVDTSPCKEPKSSGFVSFPIVAPSVEDAQERDAPNLDLALGAERKPKSGILPLFFPLTGKVTEEVKPPDPTVGNGDDGAASLSLSLAFPFPEERQAQRREDNLLPERAKPDTSLLLFGRFTDS